MWRNSDELTQAFSSGDPVQVADALASLDASMEGLEQLTVAAPDPSALNGFPATLPADVTEAFLRVILRGDYFTPPLTTGQQAALLLRTATRHRLPSFPLEASLLIKASSSPLPMLMETLDRFGNEETGPSAGEVLSDFCDFLWSGDTTIRTLTIRAMQTWSPPPSLRSAVASALRDAPT